MRKKYKMIGVVSVILTLMFSILYPYAGLAEKDGDAEERQVEQTVAEPTEQTVEESSDQPEAADTDSSSDGAGASGSSEVSLYPITATTKVAENSRYTLYIDPATGNIRVVGKQSGKEWLGSPQVDRKTMPNNKLFMDSPVHVKYTTGADTSQTYTLKKDEQTNMSIENIESGVRVTFELTTLKLTFAVEFRLLEDGIEAAVPYESIKEEGNARLVSLEILPFLHAGDEKEEGAVFLPDGSGALMTFRPDHPKYFSGYSQPVYGPDHAFKVQSFSYIDQIWRRERAPKEMVALPVYGIYWNGSAVLGIITEGEEDAVINGTPSGIRNIPLYRSSAEFVYRKTDIIFIGNSGQIPLFQGHKIKGDRKIRYKLIEGKDADYVGLAKAYREYLMKEKGVGSVVPERMPMQVQLLGGVQQKEIIGNSFIAMTTFEQARAIIDELTGKGVNNVELTVAGWSKDGLYGNQPDHFPADKKLGGTKGLKQLAAYAQEKGATLYLQTNYVKPYGASDGMKAKKDAIRGIDREVMEFYNHYIATGFNNRRQVFYMTKPERVFDKRIRRELDEFADLGIAGVSLKYMGDTIYSDMDLKSLTDRKQTAEVWANALDSFREKVGKTAVEYGFAYTFGSVDRIDNAPLDSSHFVYTDQTVPFYQIALHGLVPYTSRPVNLRDDARVEYLRAVEYGALPSYELTWEPTSKLKRTIETRLFSSSFHYWIGDLEEQYREFAGIYEQTGNQPIENHERISESVYRTTYANGTQIIVNYGSEAVTVDGLTVNALDYAVKGGR
ncbi:DUF5696 domain-containing protein [Paenibacillus tarimensis]